MLSQDGWASIHRLRAFECVCCELHVNTSLNWKTQGAFGYFSRCWEKYLAAVPWHNNKRQRIGGETIPPTSKDTNTKKPRRNHFCGAFQSNPRDHYIPKLQTHPSIKLILQRHQVRTRCANVDKAGSLVVGDVVFVNALTISKNQQNQPKTT